MVCELKSKGQLLRPVRETQALNTIASHADTIQPRVKQNRDEKVDSDSMLLADELNDCFMFGQNE
jgi:hypothetical protein